jgi:hypothetical protein
MARGDLNASQSGTNERGDALTDRRIETSIVRVLNAKFGLSERVVQQIQELSGARGQQQDGSRPRAAVRRQDLSAFNRMDQLSSKAVTAAPTAADFNALRDDVRAIYEALSIIVQAVNS